MLDSAESDIRGQSNIDNKDLHVREMRLSDLDRVFDLEIECFPDPWSKESIRNELLQNDLSLPIVLLHADEIIGYSIYWCFDIEAHIATFAIEPRFRRMKIGSYFLNHILDDIRGKNITEIYLEVRESNLAARNLYIKHGFKEVGKRKGYYAKHKEHAVLMSMHLKEG